LTIVVAISHAILITASNLENPLPEKLEKLMLDIIGMAQVSRNQPFY